MRQTRVEYYSEMTRFVANRSSCLRRQVGAVITVDGRVVATGYNGPPSRFRHCSVEHGGCLKGNAPSGGGLDKCPAIHAEANAILQAAYLGISINGSTLYVSVKPCFECIKLIINCGISSVLYLEDYGCPTSYLYNQIVESSGINMSQIS